VFGCVLVEGAGRKRQADLQDKWVDLGWLFIFTPFVQTKGHITSNTLYLYKLNRTIDNQNGINSTEKHECPVASSTPYTDNNPGKNNADADELSRMTIDMEIYMEECTKEVQQVISASMECVAVERESPQV